MSRVALQGLQVQDPALESAIRGRLEEVEVALAEAVRREPGMLAETSQYLLAAGGKRFRPMLVLVAGEFGVLPGHTPFITALKQGTLSYRQKGGA